MRLFIITSAQRYHCGGFSSNTESGSLIAGVIRNTTMITGKIKKVILPSLHQSKSGFAPIPIRRCWQGRWLFIKTSIIGGFGQASSMTRWFTVQWLSDGNAVTDIFAGSFLHFRYREDHDTDAAGTRLSGLNAIWWGCGQHCWLVHFDNLAIRRLRLNVQRRTSFDNIYQRYEFSDNYGQIAIQIIFYNGRHIIMGQQWFSVGLMLKLGYDIIMTELLIPDGTSAR